MNDQPIMLTENDKEFIELVYNDLCHIKSECEGNPTDHQLRRLSVQLRHLIVDDRLIQCWRLLKLEPKQPIIEAVRLRTETFSSQTIAASTGANLNGMQVSHVAVTYGSIPSDEQREQMYKNILDDMSYKFKLGDYKESCSMFVYGKKINRRQVISYVANKEGGAHFDKTRNRKDDQVYKVLDDSKNSFVLFGDPKGMDGSASIGKNLVYSEIISIGQSIVNSQDVARFMDCCRSILGIV